MSKPFKSLEDVVKLPSVNVLFGRRGAGKSAMCHYLLDKLSKKYKIIPGIVGFPKESKHLLPDNFRIFDNFRFPNNSVIFIDEGSFYLHARRSSQQSNLLMDQLLATARHKNLILMIATHHSTKLDIGVVRDADAVFFKEPSVLSVKYGSRAGFLANLTQKAKKEFQAYPEGLRKGYVYVFTEEFEGMLYNTLPPFWSEKLSCTTVMPIDLAEQIKELSK